MQKFESMRRQAKGQSRPVTRLGHQVRQRIFWEGPKVFKKYPSILDCVQHIFPGEAKNLVGGPLCACLVMSLGQTPKFI